MRSCHLPMVFLFTLPVALVAQDNSNCTALLQHGIYDTYRQTSAALDSSQYKTALCDQYAKLQTDKKAAKTAATYGIRNVMHEENC
jgi:hypothetical protein